jgi:hypothetical protein
VKEKPASKRLINDGKGYEEFNLFKYNDSHHTYEREWYSKTLLISKDELNQSEVNEPTFYN